MSELFTKDYYRGENYKDYFKTRWWKHLNIKLIYSNISAKCFICSRTNKLLIHHVSYDNLFAEILGIDVFVLCFDCHTRTHFHRNGDKVPLESDVLLRRMKLLKYTYRIRSFRLGSFVNTICNYIFFKYA